MSWFDTAGIANLAKTAFKEAQKTIDKALVINEEESVPSSSSSTTGEGEKKDVTESFFSSWGLGGSQPTSPGSNASQTRTAASTPLWGSFSGSFFEAPSPTTESNMTSGGASVVKQPKAASRSMSLELNTDAPLPVPPAPPEAPAFPAEVVVRRREHPRAPNSNRVSAAMSSEGSDRRSTDSCDLVESPSLSAADCSHSSIDVIPTSPSTRYSSESVSPVSESIEVCAEEDGGTSASEATVVAVETADWPSSSCEGTLVDSDGSFRAETESTFRNEQENAFQSEVPEGFQEINITPEIESEEVAEQLEMPGAQSPPVSDRSDAVKIGSSGHTSGDELETTTSSDIEIISSATGNGDSSSTASRQSPSKAVDHHRSALGALSRVVRPEGHRRVPSEASSGGSDDGLEGDRLLKRLHDMKELLEARESKLIDLSRINAALHETNSQLKNELERREESDEAKTLTQRLAAMERKFHQAIREKEQLVNQLDAAKGKAKAAEEDAEKDQIILELRTEGEKLSKQHLLLNNTIKKLRAQEKENNKLISSLKEEVGSLKQEQERWKKTVSAKEEMEHQHMEAVSALTRQRDKLEKEVNQLRTDVDRLSTGIVSMQKDLSSKEDALLAKEKRLAAAENEAAARASAAADLEAAERQTSSLQVALQDMAAQLASREEAHGKAVAALRRELAEAEARVELSERRAEEATAAAGGATEPLLKQLAALTAAHDTLQRDSAAAQATSVGRVECLEVRLEAALAAEKSARAEYQAISATKAALMGERDAAISKADNLSRRLDEADWLAEQQKQSHKEQIDHLEEQVNKLKEALEESRRETQAVQDQLSVTRAALEAEKNSSSIMARESSPLVQQIQAAESMGLSPSGSPTLSHGRISLTDSTHSMLWPAVGEDLVDMGREWSNRPADAPLIDALQAQLKQREGELQQTQWEICRLETERSALAGEVVELSGTVGVLREKLSSLSNLQTGYDALLTMYGEKLEENQELRMDLQDVKCMFKAQIEELLQKQESRKECQTSS